MGVKYVKDFEFSSSGGFHGDVQRYAKGGHVTKMPAKAKASAKDMPARAKPNAPAKGAPKMMSKPKVGKGQGYAEGGSVPGREMDRLPTKKPPGRGKDLAPSKPFKGAYEGYADGGEIGIAEDPTYEERMDRMRQRGDERLPVRGEIIAPMARDPFERTSGPGTPDGMKVNPRYGQPGESYYVPDMTREGMGETRGGAKELIDVVSPLDRAAAIRRRAMMPDANLMRRAAQAVRAPMVERGRPMPVARRAMIVPRRRSSLNPIAELSAPLMYAKGGHVTKGEKKIGKVMGEYKRGELHSGSKKGPVVKNPKQAIAIALSEARKAGAKIPKKAEGGPLSYAESGSKAPKERSFKEAFRDAREVAKREGRDPDKEVFTWKGEKYKANLEKKVSPEKKETSEKSSRRMSSEEFVKEYEKAPASGRMKQEAYYKARPEPGAEMVSPEEAILGPKAKAALAGAGATAAGYGLKKARDFLMRRGQKARSEAADVLKGSGAMSRSAAAREAEAAAYAERLKNARRSPGMTGYAKGGEVDYTKAKDLKNKGIFNDEYLAYGDKKEPYRGSPKKAKMLGRQDRLAREAMERAEKYAPGMSLDMKAKGGLSKHEDVKMDKQLIRSAVHKHESAMHPGKAKTKLRHGGMPSYGRKPMYGGGKC